MNALQPLSGVLGKRRAKHLLNRVSYNITKARIDEFAMLTVDQALTRLLIVPPKKNNHPVGDIKGTAYSNFFLPPTISNDESLPAFFLIEAIRNWWMDEAMNDTSARSKMTYFLFSFLSITSNILAASRGSFFDYLRLLEQYSLGNFRDLMYQITINNVMLVYLNNNQNRKNRPNENYAREVLELFTIGRGEQVAPDEYTNYTEADIVVAAKLLTGWSADATRGNFEGGNNGQIPTGRPVPSRHDFGEKIFSDRFNNFKIDAWNDRGKTNDEKIARMKEELVLFFEMIFAQDETAKFICRKIYRYYVSGNITDDVELNVIDPLASVFRTNYSFEETISALFKSSHFYDADDANSGDEIMGALVKSPLNLTLQTLSILNYPVIGPSTDLEKHNRFYRDLNNKILTPSSQNIFDPPSVAGFPPIYEAPSFDRFWFNSSTLIPRFNVGTTVLNTRFADFKISTFVKNTISSPENATILVTELIELFFPNDVAPDRIDYFVNQVLLLGDLTAAMWRGAWLTFIANDNRTNTMEVETALAPLFEALIWSQEYQLN